MLHHVAADNSLKIRCDTRSVQMLHNCGPACRGCQCCWNAVLLQIFQDLMHARLLGKAFPFFLFLKSPAAILMQFFKRHIDALLCFRCLEHFLRALQCPSDTGFGNLVHIFKAPGLRRFSPALHIHPLGIKEDTVHIKYHCGYCCLHNSPHIQSTIRLLPIPMIPIILRVNSNR